jgi:8-oxo-dGTP pyrophosphatase MutT (NUDIX family)
MNVVYAQEEFPSEIAQSIMLCGPTPRSVSIPSWRPLALALLEQFGYEGTVFVPEPRSGIWNSDYSFQIEWESEALNRADCILFWIPRDLTPDEDGRPRMAALTTNDEWGTWKTSGKVVLGTPPPTSGLHVNYQRYYAKKYNVPLFDALDATLRAAMTMVTPGVTRVGEECLIPQNIWRTQAFQAWYASQKAAGNRLNQARVTWSLQTEDGFPILWALYVNVYIRGEGRNQTNEVVIGRPDISTVVLWSRAPSLRDTEILLVREFRSCVRTRDGFVHALPGGSSREHGSPDQTAVEELREETGFQLAREALTAHPLRQVAASISSFCANCFSAEIDAAGMALVKKSLGSAHGVEEDGERTYIEVMTVGQLLDQPLTDWSTLGMVFMALSKAMR